MGRHNSPRVAWSAISFLPSTTGTSWSGTGHWKITNGFFTGVYYFAFSRNQVQMLWSSTCPVHMVWEREAWDWLVVRYDVDYMQFLVLVMANVQRVLSIQVLFISCIKKRILQSLICFCWIYSKSTYCCMLFTLTMFSCFSKSVEWWY